MKPLKQQGVLGIRVVSLLVLFAGIFFSAPSDALQVGDRVQANGTVSVRSTPAGTSLGTQTSGNQGNIIGGPQPASLNGASYTWWNVNWDAGVDGWVADIGLTLVTPTAPTPSSPSGSQVITTLTPSLTWSGGSNFSSLQINVSKSPYGGCPGTGNCVYTSAWLSAGTTSVTVSPALVAGTSYRWDVTACSGASGTGTCVTGSSNAYFSTQAVTVTPTAPTPSSPSGSQVITTLTPSLTWSGGSNFSSLQINVSKSPYGGCPGTGNCVYTSAWLSAGTTSVTVSPALVAGTSYRWDVTACSGASGTGTCVTGSSNAYFSTQAVTVTPVLSVTPTSRSVGATPAGSTSFSVSNTGSGTLSYSASVTSGSSWLSITSGASGGNSGTINVSYSANTGAQQSGTIEVTASGASGSPVTLTVTQAAFSTSQSFVWPVDSPNSISNGYATFNAIGNGKYHAGLDITSSTGSLIVRAAASGTVRTVPLGTYANENHGMGNVVIIDHNNGNAPFTVYAHLASITVANGQYVTGGAQIGVMGNTGTGNPVGVGIHLHFEAKIWGVFGNLSDDLGPVWGYTLNHPSLNGYINPRPYLEFNISTLSPVAVISSANQIVRTGPDPTSYTTAVASVTTGQQFAAFAAYNGWYQVSLPSIDGPASGWIQGDQDSSLALLEITDSQRGVTGVSVRAGASATETKLANTWDKQWLVNIGSASSGNGCTLQWYQAPLASNTGASVGWLCGQYAILHGSSIAPVVTQQPSNQTVSAGQTASFSALASGMPTPVMQWQVSTNGGASSADISGATSTIYSFITTALQSGNQYKAVFTNSAGIATTNTATLTVMTIVPAGQITVTVRRSDTNAVLSGATVLLSGGPSSPASQPTGLDGTTIFSNLLPGTYTATASLSGFQINNTQATVSANTTTPVAISLVPTGPTTGTLNVTTTPVSGNIYVDGMLRGNGSISISLPAGPHTISFGEVSGYITPSPRSVIIAANEIRGITEPYNVIVLEKVSLLSPFNDATGVSITPPFGWSGVNGANRYWLMVATDSSHFPTDPNATTCPNCVISGFTDSTNYTLPHDFPFGGRSGTLSINTLYYWKVQARNTNGARGDYSDAFRFTTAAPESTPPPPHVDPPVDTTVALTPGDKAVVIAHGWNSDAFTRDDSTRPPSWVAEMAMDICKSLGHTVNHGDLPKDNRQGLTLICQANHNNTHWDVWVKDWRDDARADALVVTNSDLLGINFPKEILPLAETHGNSLASILKERNYHHIHFIAHSAGAKLIATAGLGVKLWAGLEARPALTIHETFLDAYDALKASSYGQALVDWADHYVDMRDLTPLGLGDGTQLLLSGAYNYNVDVTGDNLNVFSCGYVCRHSRPYRFYGQSIDNDFMKDDANMKSDPIDSPAGMGFPLSVEAGVSLDTLKTTYKNGETCGVSGTSCLSNYHPIPGPVAYAVVKATEAVVDGVTTAVDYVEGAGAYLFNKVTMWVTDLAPQQMHAMSATATSGATTEEYLVVNVTTTSPVNTLRFNWSFAAAGEGLLRVFVGGNLVRQIDQRHVTPSSPETEEIYIGGVGEPLPAGTHRITFRLDGFGASPSGVELTNVELGLVAGPLTFPVDTLPVGEQGVAYVYDLLAEGGLPPYTWSLVSGRRNKPPRGFTLTADGTLTGIPTQARTTPFAVQVTDAAGGVVTRSFSLQVVKGVKLKTKRLASGAVGVPYAVTLQVAGGIPPLAFGPVGGALPLGLALDPGTGLISGTPAAAGTFDFQVRVTSSGGSSDQKGLRITVR